MPLTRTWSKSSYSDPNGGNCVEARQFAKGTVQVRDSKDPGGPMLSFTAECWDAFIAGVRADLDA
jgi:Domain of unknown function (DUF397)